MLKGILCLAAMALFASVAYADWVDTDYQHYNKVDPTQPFQWGTDCSEWVPDSGPGIPDWPAGMDANFVRCSDSKILGSQDYPWPQFFRIDLFLEAACDFQWDKSLAVGHTQ